MHMSYFDDPANDATAWETEMQDRWAPAATMADAHREWHLNSGNPMGTPGCPQDACHFEYPQCGTCGGYEDDCTCPPVEYDMSTIPHLWDYDEPDPYAGTGAYDDGIPF